jgi:hypothetical protein
VRETSGVLNETDMQQEGHRPRLDRRGALFKVFR